MRVDMVTVIKSREIDTFVEEIKQKQALEERRRDLKKRIDTAGTPLEKLQAQAELQTLERTATIPPGVDLMGGLLCPMPTSFGGDDSTNLYLGNLSCDVTEEFLCQEFGKFGQIMSVKIMYPRSEEERLRGRHCGFVAFAEREPAESAMNSLDGVDFYGVAVKIGWGKPVPNRPAVVRPPGAPVPPPPSGIPINQVNPPMIIPLPPPPPPPTTPMIPEGTVIYQIPSIAPPITPPPPPLATVLPGLGTPVQGTGFSDTPPTDSPGIEELIVKVPNDPRIRRLIDRISKYVALEGHQFEQIIMEKEILNGMYAFLFHQASPDHIYYRWRTFAYSQGDSVTAWRTEPFQIFIGGPMWVPPPCDKSDEAKSTNFTDGPSESGIGGSSGRGLGGPRSAQSGSISMSDADRDDFEDILRGLKMDKKSIENGLIFAIDHAESALEISECLAESLTLKETWLQNKIARLYLVSDILNNSCCTKQGAWAFRSAFEKALPSVFEHLRQVYDEVPGRVTAMTMKEKIMKIIRTWDSWAIYPQAYTQGLEVTFCRPNKLIKSFDDSLASTGDAGEDVIVDGIVCPEPLRMQLREWKKLDESTLEKMCHTKALPLSGNREKQLRRLIEYEEYWQTSETDIDGVPLDIDGEPLVDITDLPPDLYGEPLDGYPLSEDEDFDGQPLELDETDTFTALLQTSDSSIKLDATVETSAPSEEWDIDGEEMAEDEIAQIQPASPLSISSPLADVSVASAISHTKDVSDKELNIERPSIVSRSDEDTFLRDDDGLHASTVTKTSKIIEAADQVVSNESDEESSLKQDSLTTKATRRLSEKDFDRPSRSAEKNDTPSRPDRLGSPPVDDKSCKFDNSCNNRRSATSDSTPQTTRTERSRSSRSSMDNCRESRSAGYVKRTPSKSGSNLIPSDSFSQSRHQPDSPRSANSHDRRSERGLSSNKPMQLESDLAAYRSELEAKGTRPVDVERLCEQKRRMLQKINSDNNEKRQIIEKQRSRSRSRVHERVWSYDQPARNRRFAASPPRRQRFAAPKYSRRYSRERPTRSSSRGRRRR
eukprot:GHVL01023585.1.p1 GENE.GHVL01023585.1~~GHVL01023585.1.p1  ORF type:complete len:1053 (+),score=208.92 GHVL01023585.1:244-3402(+)